MKVLAVIVTYNGMQWVDRCIGSVLDSAVKADILVVDNGSSDGTQGYIREHFPSVELVEPGSNIGFGAANNIGFRKALDGGFDYVYLLNQDAWIFPDTIGTLAEVFSRSEGYGILSPFQADASGVTPDRRFAQKAGSLEGVGMVKEVRFIMAAHWMVSVECIRTVGGFAALFAHNGEDDNYCDRARFHGFKVGVCPQARGVHDRASRPLTKADRIRLSTLTGNMARLADINRPLWERVLSSLFVSTWKCVKYCSLRHLKNYFSVTGRLGEIRSLREESRLPGRILL